MSKLVYLPVEGEKQTYTVHHDDLFIGHVRMIARSTWEGTLDPDLVIPRWARPMIGETQTQTRIETTRRLLDLHRQIVGGIIPARSRLREHLRRIREESRS